MKKFIVLVLTLVCTLGFVGCNNSINHIGTVKDSNSNFDVNNSGDLNTKPDSTSYKSEYKSIESGVIDYKTTESLKKLAIDEVKSQLIFSDQAVFSWHDWSFGCNDNLYYVTSFVNTKSIIETRNDNPFTIIYRLNNNKYKLVYLFLMTP